MERLSKRSKVYAIILCALGAIIFIYSVFTTIRDGSFYIGTLHQSFITFIIGIIFGRTGWGLHFGLTLLLIGVYLLREPKKHSTVEVLGTETDDVECMERPNHISVLEWFGILILLNIPLLNLILLLIWAFGAENSKKNFSRAVLLYFVVVFVIVITIFLATAHSFMY